MDTLAANPKATVATCVCGRAFKSMWNAIEHKAMSTLTCSCGDVARNTALPESCAKQLSGITEAFKSFLLREFVMGRTAKRAKDDGDKWLIARTNACSR